MLTNYESLTVTVAVVAAGVALLSWIRAGLAMSIAKRANDLIERTSEPHLIFSCDTVEQGNEFFVTITLFNSGTHHTEIVDGEISVQPYQNPDAEETRPLSGTKIGGRTKHPEQFKVHRTMVKMNGTRETTTHFDCRAIYTRPEQSNAPAEECYIYEKGRRKWVTYRKQKVG